MADAAKPVDPVTGTDTTGHVWDDIRELNTPLPRWWLFTLYATIVWSIAYWIVYPSWPLVSDYTRGVLGYSERASVLEEFAAAKAARGALGAELASASLEEIRAGPELLRLAIATGKAAFGDNCAACHGSGGAGAPGYPSLQDDEWLWGGTLEDIHRTIRFGARSGHAETRQSEMLAFGRDGVLKRQEIESVANCVLSSVSTYSDAILRPSASAKRWTAVRWASMPRPERRWRSVETL